MGETFDGGVCDIYIYTRCCTLAWLVLSNSAYQLTLILGAWLAGHGMVKAS